MEVKKTEKVMKEVEEVLEQYTICDKCGKRITKESTYDATDFEFELTEGSKYPEGGSGTKFTLDLCNDCANDSVTLLRENGFKVQEKEWSY